MLQSYRGMTRLSEYVSPVGCFFRFVLLNFSQLISKISILRVTFTSCGAFISRADGGARSVKRGDDDAMPFRGQHRVTP